ncbi:MAG: hypothetical protein HY329_17530, partial [Chloroflexi bacterium]|nr:hypothetical protein [Chloroflexota bacterium]
MVSGGQVAFSPRAEPAWSDPAIVAQRPVERAEGRALEAEIRVANAGGRLLLGFQNGRTALRRATAHALAFGSAGVLSRRDGSAIVGVGSWTPNTTYRVRVELLAPAGARYLIQGGSFEPLGGSTWTDLGRSSSVSATALHPALVNYDATGTLAYLRVGDATAPAPPDPTATPTVTPTSVPSPTRTPTVTSTPSPVPTLTATSTPSPTPVPPTPVSSPAGGVEGPIAAVTASPGPTGAPTSAVAEPVPGGTATATAVVRNATASPTTPPTLTPTASGTRATTTTPTLSPPAVSPTRTVWATVTGGPAPELSPTATLTTAPTGTTSAAPVAPPLPTATQPIVPALPTAETQSPFPVGSATPTAVATGQSARASVERRLSGAGMDQGRAKPKGQVTVELTVRATQGVDQAVLADSFPASWALVADGDGQLTRQGTAVRIAWPLGDLKAGAVVRRSYTVSGPARPHADPTATPASVSQLQAFAGEDDPQSVSARAALRAIAELGQERRTSSVAPAQVQSLAATPGDTSPAVFTATLETAGGSVPGDTTVVELAPLMDPVDPPLH